MIEGSNWQTLIANCEQLMSDMTFPSVRQWLDQHPGGRVVGHFQVYFPEEIVHAAGMLPLKVMGASDWIEARRADTRLASFVCSICRTSLELGLSGRLPFLSAFYSLPICDAARSMAGLWGRNFPEQPGGILYLPQNANSGYSAQYLRTEYGRLQHDLEELGGRPITNDALWQSIRIFNENRRLLRELSRIKRESPWLLAGSEAYILARVGSVMPREEHNALLQRAIELLQAREGRRQDKIRVVFEGGFCETPALDLLRTIEDSCYIVADDLLIGMRWLTEDVPETAGDALMALAESYLDRSEYSPVQHDTRKPKEAMLLQRIRQSGAQACIVGAAKMCEPGLDEQVAYSKALEAANVPFLVTEFEEKETAFEQIRMQVETFAESILFD